MGLLILNLQHKKCPFQGIIRNSLTVWANVQRILCYCGHSPQWVNELSLKHFRTSVSVGVYIYGQFLDSDFLISSLSFSLMFDFR